ncbi:MAG TPA: LysM peptidoglycan-binding domain-containing protein [Bacilli bacterium]|nr:LysM peptidoglycan-binding domain-containing protein [Bacilli bacterium]
MDKTNQKKDTKLKKAVALVLAVVSVITIGVVGRKIEKKKIDITETTSTTQKDDSEEKDIVIIKIGDTLSSIADYYGTTVEAILKLNPQIKNPNIIHVGQSIYVPHIVNSPRKTMGEQIEERGSAFGIDISYAQEGMDYKRVLQLNPEISFGILRMFYFWWNKDKLDNNFEKQAKLFHEMGVPIGVYIWPTATSDAEVEKEVKMTIDELEKIKELYGIELELPIFLDIENESGAENLYERLVKKDPNTIRLLQKTISMFEDAGYYVCIYCNLDMAGIMYRTGHDFKVGYWIAAYDIKTEDVLKRVNQPVIGHQFSSKGKLKGHKGNVDCNEVFIDLQKIIKDEGLNNTGNKTR